MVNDKVEAFYNRSLERALCILNAFNIDRQTLTAAELARMVGLPRATVMRLCHTLVKYRFLRQEKESKRYSLGIKLFELGSIVFNSMSLRRIASPYLKELQKRLGLPIFLGVIDDDELIYIDKKEDMKNPVMLTSQIGTRRPPYWGLLGPALMAYLPEEEVKRLLQRSPLKATTRYSITNEDEFMELLKTVKEKGYYYDRERSINGISGIGAPIFNYTNKVIGAIGAVYISSSMDSEGFEKTAEEVKRVALEISIELGYLSKEGR